MESGSENKQDNAGSEPQTDDDVVEVEISAAEIMKRRLTADVWDDFKMLPLGPDKKQRCACKRCGTTYACPSSYGTGPGSSSKQRRGGLNRCENLFANEAEDVMKELDEYENDESFLGTQKTQLELYVEEPKLDRKANLNVLDFWKGNRFRYPELAVMACDILCIPITTVASEAAFSAGGRVLNKYRTSLLPENAETLICTRDWLYGEKATAELQLEDLCEDILNLDLNKDDSRNSRVAD